MVVSQPHFYQGEEKLWKMVDGMPNPALNTSRYETFSYIEPYTGVSLKAHARLQVFVISFECTLLSISNMLKS